MYYYYYGRRDRKTWQPFGVYTFISIRVSSLVRFLPQSSGRAVNQTRGPHIIYNNIIHASTDPRPGRRILYIQSTAAATRQKHCCLSCLSQHIHSSNKIHIIIICHEIRVTSACGRDVM